MNRTSNVTVTVVVITKNQRTYLERSLPALAAQRGVSRFETVVVDSGSTDGALDVVREHGAKLVQIAPEAFGYARAYNLGAAHGTGKYIVRLSGDAIPIGTDWLMGLLVPMETDESIGATWGAQTLPPGLRNPVEHFCQKLYGYDAGKNAKPVRITRLCTVLGCNMATRRDLWERFPFPDIAQVEDYAFYGKLLQDGFAGTFVPGARVLHGHEESLSKALSRSLKQSFWQVIIRIRLFLQK
ncbi:MAG: glycosyltransferase [Armatimonadetes bacterium]|nr:glycosyltransferase [Armatimonadota bacterium]